MSRVAARRTSIALLMVLCVIGLLALGQEHDTWAERDARCAQYEKHYSHTERACVPMER